MELKITSSDYFNIESLFTVGFRFVIKNVIYEVIDFVKDYSITRSGCFTPAWVLRTPTKYLVYHFDELVGKTIKY